MISKVTKAVVCFMCFSFLIGLCGCGSAKNNVVDKSGKNNFAQMTQEEKQLFIVDYLIEQYGIETTVSDVQKRQINAFESEENYYAIAKYNDTERIYCWITDEGTVYDSNFVNNLSDNIDNLFKQKIGDSLKDYKVICKSTLNSPSKTAWNENNVETMLGEEDITTSVRIFVNKNEKNSAIHLAENKFDNVFSFTTGTCYIYFVDDTNNIDINIDELVAFDAKFDFTKD